MEPLKQSPGARAYMMISPDSRRGGSKNNVSKDIVTRYTRSGCAGRHELKLLAATHEWWKTTCQLRTGGAARAE
ncbi:MAG: hypothetical protein M5R42_15235 [Rhodocyclaceae bacterium]|nr:hypothetical protein [Rhodocyclaceae bacterium]